MGLFDLFGKDPKTKEERLGNTFNDSEHFNGISTGQKGPVLVCVPKCYDDVSKIIDALKNGKTPVVHLTELKNETALRILDMLSGAVYALGGGIYEMEKNVFLLSPTGVEING